MTNYRDQLNYRLKMQYHPPVPNSNDFSNDEDDTDTDTDGSSSDSDPNIGPEPNYMCVECSTEVYIESEHKRITTNWCASCGSVKRHQQINKESSSV